MLFPILSYIIHIFFSWRITGFCLESHDRCTSLEGESPTRNILLDIFVHTGLKYVPRNWRSVTQIALLCAGRFFC
jgi:hypothetical protein